MVSREPEHVAVVDGVLGQGPKHDGDVVRVLDEPFIAGERHAQVAAMAHVEPREVGPDASELGVIGTHSVVAMERPVPVEARLGEVDQKRRQPSHLV